MRKQLLAFKKHLMMKVVQLLLAKLISEASSSTQLPVNGSYIYIFYYATKEAVHILPTKAGSGDQLVLYKH